jgi:hypothetical protein
MTSARTGSIVVLASLFAVSACGSSAKKVDPAADLALAKRAVLTKADLAGYTEAPHTAADDLPAPLKKSFAACQKVSTTFFDDAPGGQRANSSEFSKGESQISATAKIYVKTNEINQHFDEVSNAATGGCLQKLFEAAAKSGESNGQKVTVSKESVSRFDLGVGSHSVGYAVQLTLASGPRTAAFFADVIFLQRDRAGLDFEFVDLGTAPDHTFETALVQKSYDRIGNDAK